jgi:hypothetical protein
MRIAGQTGLQPITRVIELPRGDHEPLRVEITPLSLGFQTRLRQNGVVPPAPRLEVLRDASGKAMRDPDGQLLVRPDDQGAEYLADCERYFQRVAVLSIATSLESSSKVELETNRADFGQDWSAYADQLLAEFAASGWIAGDLVLLATAIADLSNLTPGDVAGGQRSFSKRQ